MEKTPKPSRKISTKHAPKGEVVTESQFPAPAPPPEPLTFRISGIPFTTLPRYHAGHIITPGEAEALNQQLAQTLRNNFASKIPTGTPSSEELQAKFTEFWATYEFEVSADRGNPEYHEVLRQAWKIIKHKYPDELYGRQMTLVHEYLASPQGETLRAQVRTYIAALRSLDV